MSDVTHYDSIVIGAGQGGGPLSTALSRAGRKTALIEQTNLGGTCVNEGCTPTKTMIASARVAHLVRRAADYGVNTGPISVDLAKVRQRKRDIVTMFRGGSERGVAKSDVTLLMGAGRFIGPTEVEVRLNSGGMRTLSADRIFINTGTRSVRPDLDGLADVDTLNSASIMELSEVPGHLVVIGGGYIGLEFGQMFRRFGSDVTIVHRGDQLLKREDPDIAAAVLDILRGDGINVILNASPNRVESSDDGLKLIVKTTDGLRTVVGSHLLLAGGRIPNTDRLNLAAAGVDTDDRGYITVNDRLETSAAGIYALGDVKGGPAFTHIAYDDYRILKANLLDGGDRSTKGRLVPYTLFIDPQLGRVGLTETEAIKQGFNIRVATLPMTHVARAIETGETRGLMKAVVDKDTNRILGAAILGLEGGEVASVVQMAMLGDLPYTVLRDAAISHPTLAESLNNLFMAMDRK